jgi:hypothetical protein
MHKNKFLFLYKLTKIKALTIIKNFAIIIIQDKERQQEASPKKS